MTDTTPTTLSLPLEAIHLPAVPGFWPAAWGWWGLLGCIIIVIVSVVFIGKWRKNRLKAKKAAIALLMMEKSRITPSGAMELVRQAALSYYPRNHIAQLSGGEWLTFLDSQLKSPIFNAHQADWFNALYQQEKVENREQLIEQCETWLHNALPPKRSDR